MAEQLTREEKKLLKEITREDKENVIYTSFFETDRFILEQIHTTTTTTTTTTTGPIVPSSAARATRATLAANTRFFYYEKGSASKESFDYLDELEYAGKVIKPIEDKILEKGVVLLPSGIEEYGTTGELIEEISLFLTRYFQVPSFFEKFLPYIILFYWVYEQFPFVPYVHFVGLTGTGKTTAQEVVGSICYKPIDASGAITMSPIFRVADTWRGTLLLDEFQPEGDGYKEMLGLLKGGVGNKAILRTEGDKKRETVPYLLKSPKIFTSEQPIADAGLRSRTFVVQMDKNTRRVPLFRLNRFNDEAQLLRNKLLLWRLRHMNEIHLEDIEYGFEELSGFDGRVQQVITPIYFLSDEKTRSVIMDFSQIQETETKKERSESLEGQIFQAIIDTLPNDISLKALTESINSDRARRPYTEKRIANIVRKVLQIAIKRTGHEKISTVMSSESPIRIKDLQKYFGAYPAADDARAASDAPQEMEGTNAPKNATRSNDDLDITQEAYLSEAEKENL